jgi:hypothetical protein
MTTGMMAPIFMQEISTFATNLVIEKFRVRGIRYGIN